MRHARVMVRAAFSSGFAIALFACGAAPTPHAPSSHAQAAPTVCPPGAEMPMPKTAFQPDDASPKNKNDDDAVSTTHVKSFEARTISRDPDTRRRYVGAPVTIDTKNADLADVCRILATTGNVNIVVPGDLQAKVTLRLVHVPWDQALDTVLAVNGLASQRNGNVILVRKQSDVQKERDDEARQSAFEEAR